MPQKTAQTKIEKPKLEVKRWIIPALTGFFVIVLVAVSFIIKPQSIQLVPSNESTKSAQLLPAETIALPTPDYRSNNSVEATLKSRRTRRDFIDKEISLKQVSQMLWAAQGVTADWGERTAPSTKSTYPLSIFLIANKVEGLNPGEYQYLPGDRVPVNLLKPIKEVELQKALYETMNESSLKSAPAVLIVTGNMGKMAESFGGIPHDKEVYIEAGHVGQSLYLEAESLKLGMDELTSFEEAKIKDLVTIPATDTIIYLVPFGIPKP